jgi:hypothetical protein
VVQRLPVRIRLLPRSDEPPLRAGITATVSIDTGRQRQFGEIADYLLGLMPGSRPGIVTLGGVVCLERTVSAPLSHRSGPHVASGRGLTLSSSPAHNPNHLFNDVVVVESRRGADITLLTIA